MSKKEQALRNMYVTGTDCRISQLPAYMYMENASISQARVTCYDYRPHDITPARYALVVLWHYLY